MSRAIGSQDELRLDERLGDLGVVFVAPAGRTSHEWELISSMADRCLTVVANRPGWGADRELVVRSFSPPLLDTHEAWTAAPTWLRGISKLALGPCDVVVSQEIFSVGAFQASRLARSLGRPHAVIVAETMPDNPLYRIPPWRGIARSVSARADLFVCITERARDHLVERGCDAARCRVVNLGVDLELFRPASELVSDPVVTFIGMFRADRGADKGVLEIIEACRQVWESGEPRLRLQLVGDGHLRSELERAARSLPFLEVLPRMSRAEVASTLRGSRCLVLASKRTAKWEEQFGFVLVEAMATGLPVVSCASGAIPEVVSPWTHLCPPGDVAGLARSIRHALGPQGEVEGARNRRFAQERYDLTAQAGKLRRELEELAAPIR